MPTPPRWRCPRRGLRRALLSVLPACSVAFSGRTTSQASGGSLMASWGLRSVRLPPLRLPPLLRPCTTSLVSAGRMPHGYWVCWDGVGGTRHRNLEVLSTNGFTPASGTWHRGAESEVVRLTPSKWPAKDHLPPPPPPPRSLTVPMSHCLPNFCLRQRILEVGLGVGPTSPCSLHPASPTLS